MARDILSEFGPDHRSPQEPRAKSGGETDAKPLPYKHPVGPTSQSQKGPGLHGSVHPQGTQHKG